MKNQILPTGKKLAPNPNGNYFLKAGMKYKIYLNHDPDNFYAPKEITPPQSVFLGSIDVQVPGGNWTRVPLDKIIVYEVPIKRQIIKLVNGILYTLLAAFDAFILPGFFESRAIIVNYTMAVIFLGVGIYFFVAYLRRK
jgi:hypothetical protein